MLIRRCSLFSQTRLTHKKKLEGTQAYLVLHKEHRVGKGKEHGKKYVAVASMCERLIRKILKFCTMELKIWHHRCKIKQKYLGLGKVL